MRNKYHLLSYIPFFQPHYINKFKLNMYSTIKFESLPDHLLTTVIDWLTDLCLRPRSTLLYSFMAVRVYIGESRNTLREPPLVGKLKILVIYVSFILSNIFTFLKGLQTYFHFSGSN